MFSLLIKFFLVLKYRKKLTIGDNVKFLGCPSLQIGNNATISISDHTIIGKFCDFRAYDNSNIIISKNCKIDTGVRMIAANSNVIELASDVKIGFYSVLNGGGGIYIGESSSTYGFVYIQSSEHSRKSNGSFNKEEYTHSAVNIASNCLIYPHALILPGSKINKNTILKNNCELVEQKIEVSDVK